MGDLLPFIGEHPFVSLGIGFLLFLAFTWLCGSVVTIFRGHRPPAYCPACNCARCLDQRKGRD